jgi:hypothetical protein
MGLTFLFGEHDVPALVAGSLRRLMRKGRRPAGDDARAPDGVDTACRCLVPAAGAAGDP